MNREVKHESANREVKRQAPKILAVIAEGLPLPAALLVRAPHADLQAETTKDSLFAKQGKFAPLGGACRFLRILMIRALRA